MPARIFGNSFAATSALGLRPLPDRGSAGASSAALISATKLRGVVAVDDPVVDRDRQVHEVADDDLVAAHRRPLADLVHAQDGDLGGLMIGVAMHAAQRAQAGDRERRAGELLARRLAGAGQPRQPFDLGGQLGDRQPIRVAHDRHDQADLGRGRRGRCGGARAG